jgi:hypothetical protein
MKLFLLKLQTICRVENNNVISGKDCGNTSRIMYTITLQKYIKNTEKQLQQTEGILLVVFSGISNRIHLQSKKVR